MVNFSSVDMWKLYNIHTSSFLISIWACSHLMVPSRKYLHLFTLVLNSWTKKIDHKESEIPDRSHLHTTAVVRLADATGLARRFVLLGRRRPDQVGRLQQRNGSLLKMAQFPPPPCIASIVISFLMHVSIPCIYCVNMEEQWFKRKIMLQSKWMKNQEKT